MRRLHHPLARDIVSKHRDDAELFLVAHADPCIEIAADETRRIDRLIHAGFPDDLYRWKRPFCWMVGVVICPGDDTGPLAAFVKANGWDPLRFHFYLHADADAESLKGWVDAGLPIAALEDETKDGKPIHDWGGLHSTLGLHFNNWIVHDFGPSN